MIKREILIFEPEARKNIYEGVSNYIKFMIPILEKENTIKRLKTMIDLNLSKKGG
jgi:hypothetical protein